MNLRLLCQAIFSAADADGDGNLDMQEYYDMLEKVSSFHLTCRFPDGHLEMQESDDMPEKVSPVARLTPEHPASCRLWTRRISYAICCRQVAQDQHICRFAAPTFFLRSAHGASST
jgi:hypothetical protein